MALHDSLRELVDARGRGVTEDPAELRGALDDYLAEDEATVGEVNLLVDAVRLGALARLNTLLDRHADPGAALDEAAAALARDRATDDVRRSRWALAVLGYAVGRIDAALTALPSTAPTEPGPTPATADRPAAKEPPATSTRVLPEPDVPDDTPAAVVHPAPPTEYAAPPTGTYGGASGAPARPEPARRRTGVLVGVSAVVVLALVAGGVLLWTQRDGDDDLGGDASRRGAAAALPAAEIVVPLEVDGATHIFAVDADSGATRQLTDADGSDVLPSVSPDRTRIAYLRGPRPFTVWTQTVASAEPTRAFGDSAECGFASRPAWSPDGRRVAVVCSGDDEVPDGIYVTGGDLEDPELVVVGAGLAGAPTWVDDERFVYTVRNELSPGQLWLYDTATTSDTALDLGVDPAVRISHPDWSDDQQQLVFLVHSEPDDEYGELWTAGPDLATATPVGGDVAHPAWAPEGDRIVVTVKDAADAAVEHLAVVTATDASDPTVIDLQDVPADVVVGVPAWGAR